MKFNRSTYFFVIGIYVLSSCYESQEGCLDNLAKNYNVSADIVCDECCEYPSLGLEIQHTIGGKQYSHGDTIINNIGQKIRLLDCVYLISNVIFQLNDSIAQFGAVQTFTDRNGIMHDIHDDFVRIRCGKSKYEIGTHKTSGAFQKVDIGIGIHDFVNGGTFQQEIENDLTNGSDSLHLDNNEYIIQRLQLAIGQNLSDTVIFSIPASIGMKRVSGVLDTIIYKGFDIFINLEVDCNNWFDNIDFINDTEEEIIESLFINSENIFKF